MSDGDGEEIGDENSTDGERAAGEDGAAEERIRYVDSDEFPYPLTTAPSGLYWDPYRLDERRDQIPDEVYYRHYNEVGSEMLDGERYEEQFWVPGVEMVRTQDEGRVAGFSGVYDGELEDIVAAFEARGFELDESGTSVDSATRTDPVRLENGQSLALVAPSWVGSIPHGEDHEQLSPTEVEQVVQAFMQTVKTDADPRSPWISEAVELLGRPLTARIYNNAWTDAGVAVAWQVHEGSIVMRYILGDTEPLTEDDVEEREAWFTQSPPDLDDDELVFDMFELADRYEHLSTESTERCVVLDWEISPEKFNLLQPVDPLPMAEFDVVSLGENEYRLEHARGESLDASRVIVAGLDDGQEETGAQFSDAYEVVEPGDSIVLETDRQNLAVWWEYAPDELERIQPVYLLDE